MIVSIDWVAPLMVLLLIVLLLPVNRDWTAISIAPAPPTNRSDAAQVTRHTHSRIAVA